LGRLKFFDEFVFEVEFGAVGVADVETDTADEFWDVGGSGYFVDLNAGAGLGVG